MQNLALGILGYGAQGAAEATNLRRSELPFTLGLREGASKEKAIRDGFSPVTPEECVKKSKVILFNLPDQSQAAAYEKLIRGSGVKYLVFAHGFSTTFKKIPVEKEGPHHVLIAPKGAASGLVRYYKEPQALPAILAWESATQPQVLLEDKKWIEELALAMGCHPKALVWANFKDETVCDLFSEQALLCGGVSSLLRKSYEVLVEGGYDSTTAYFETLFELKLIVDLIWTEGISGMRSRISPTARYGDVTRGDRIIDESTKKKMKAVLQEIESGIFASEFLEKVDSPEFKKILDTQSQHPIEIRGKEIRKKMTEPTRSSNEN